MDGIMNVLFVNSPVENCGIHQYGNNEYTYLKKSDKLNVDYIKASSIRDIDEKIKTKDYKVIIFNFYQNLFNFINVNHRHFPNHACVAILHEVNSESLDAYKDGFFQRFIYADPTLETNNPLVIKMNRVIPNYDNKYSAPEIPTIGSIGFGYVRKGYDVLIDKVQEEFDEAIIKLHIPANGVIDASGVEARNYAQMCRNGIKKNGIKLEVNHDFLTHEELLDFMAKNSMNAFLYKPDNIIGVSSSTDHGITVRRPVAITKTNLFKHLHNLTPSILVEENSLKTIIENGLKPFEDMYKNSTEERHVENMEKIILDLIQ
jgi:glycosyltransferase involved in cell wall biosynthesis